MLTGLPRLLCASQQATLLAMKIHTTPSLRDCFVVPPRNDEKPIKMRFCWRGFAIRASPVS